jgi:hypothetical protein
MTHPSSKLNQRQNEELSAQTQQTQQSHEFATPEELLRYDAGQTPVPPAVETRLRRSLASEPRPKRGWWLRLFGRP